MRRIGVMLVAVVFAAGACSGGDDTMSDKRLLEACEDARLEWEIRVGLGLAGEVGDDGNYSGIPWEAWTTPLAEIEGRHTYETGVIDVWGYTDDIKWACLYLPPTEEAKWSWTDEQPLRPELAAETRE